MRPGRERRRILGGVTDHVGERPARLHAETVVTRRRLRAGLQAQGRGQRDHRAVVGAQREFRVVHTHAPLRAGLVQLAAQRRIRTDATGHADLGANWNLELKTGAIDSDLAVGRYAQEAWRDVLALHTLDFDTVGAWTSGTSKTYTVDGYPVTISYSGSLNGNPQLASDYNGGVTPAQNALQFTVGPTGSNTITIDFSGQPGGSVSNVGFALYDVDNDESAVFTANQAGVGAIAPTQVATSANNSVTASSATSACSGSITTRAATSRTAIASTYPLRCSSRTRTASAGRRACSTTTPSSVRRARCVP